MSPALDLLRFLLRFVFFILNFFSLALFLFLLSSSASGSSSLVSYSNDKPSLDDRKYCNTYSLNLLHHCKLNRIRGQLTVSVMVKLPPATDMNHLRRVHEGRYPRLSRRCSEAPCAPLAINIIEPFFSMGNACHIK